MEIELTAREQPVYLPEPTQHRRTTLTAESVIPDTLPDVSRILSVRGGLLLKGKELRPQGVMVEGEARAWVLYLAEDGQSMETLGLEKPFSMEFELPEADEEALPQIAWRLTGLEGRILNPRKLAADFAVTADLDACTRGSLVTAWELPEGEHPGLHLLRRETECTALTGVCEKPFTLREQLAFPAGSRIPVKLAGEELRFVPLGCEQIGDRAVAKGELRLSVRGLDENGEPTREDFTLPFSQLMETGPGSPEQFSLRIEPCSAFLELSEAVNGERMLDAEVHAVAQLRSWSRFTVSDAADAYSGKVPCGCRFEEHSLPCAQTREKALLRAEEALEMPEDCGELLLAEPGFLQPERDGGAAVLPLELIYRSVDGVPSAARRSVRLKGAALADGFAAGEGQVIRCELRGNPPAVHAEAELSVERQERQSLRSLTGITMAEDAAPAPGSLPALTLVRRGGESLWDLAKACGSSEELILRWNDPEAALLLIPRE